MHAYTRMWGGSYPEAESGLSKVALEWMLVEAKAAGLQVDLDKANVVLGRKNKTYPWMPDYVKPNPAARPHESLRGFWWLLEFVPHRDVQLMSGRVRYRFLKGRQRDVPEGSTTGISEITP
jgi:hypothetical protein